MEQRMTKKDYYMRIRLSYLRALGGECIVCGERDPGKLEVHDISGEHKGANNKMRIKDLIDFKKTGKVKPGRFILCIDHHDEWHGTDAIKVKLARKEEIKQMEKQQYEEGKEKQLPYPNQPEYIESCPCEDAQTSADCEQCQDLPFGYFEYLRKLRRDQQ